MVPTLLGLQGRLGLGSRRWAWVTPAVCALGLVLLATPGLAGHAATGSSPTLGLGLDVAHLAAAAAWLGGLALLATFLVPRTEVDTLPSDPMLLTRRVSFVAFCAVVLIVATGVFQSIRQVGSFYALFHTVYGRTLLVKIALVVLLIGLGAISRRIVHTSAEEVSRMLEGRRPLIRRSPPHLWRRIPALLSRERAHRGSGGFLIG